MPVFARMWEARVEPGRLDDAVRWLQDSVVSRALHEPGCLDAEVFRSSDEPARVVLITRWDASCDFDEGAPPSGVVARANAWAFELVLPRA